MGEKRSENEDVAPAAVWYVSFPLACFLFGLVRV